jgi:YcxB-like protein
VIILDAKTIAFGGQITREQFTLLQNSLIPWWFKTYLFGLGFFLFMVTFGTGWSLAIQSPIKIIPEFLMTLMMLLFIWGSLSYKRNRLWKETYKLHGNVVNGKISDIEIDWNTEISSVKFPWNKFLYFKEIPDMILIFYMPQCCLYFPKSFFSSEYVWITFKQIVASKIRRK